MNASILLFGGRSDERLVSAASAQNLAQRFQFSELVFMAPDGAVTRVTPQELAAHERPFETQFKSKQAPFSPNFRHALASFRGKTVFIGLHGTEGEDGTLQAEFEKAGVAYTGSDAKASHACFDKLKAKRIVMAKNLATAAQLQLPNLPPALEARKPMESRLLTDLAAFLKANGKVILKPVESGSSFGLHFISDEVTLKRAVSAILVAPYERYLAEKFIVGRELTVGVLDDGRAPTALPASEVVMAEGLQFDYEGKYLGRGSHEIAPAALSDSEMAAAQKLAVEAHVALGCAGYSRTDMILTAEGPYFLETNTLPGLSKASFIPQQLEAAKMPITSFIESQLRLAEARLAGERAQLAP